MLGKNEISKCSQFVTFESRFLALLAAPSDDAIVDVTGNTVRKVTRKEKRGSDGYIRGFLFLPLYENLVYTKLINLFLKCMSGISFRWFSEQEIVISKPSKEM